MKKRENDLGFLGQILLICLLVFVDIVVKVGFAEYFVSNPAIVLIPNFLTLTYIENTGASFGIFAGQTLFLTILSGVFILLILALIFFTKSAKTSKLLKSGYIILVAGAIGNFIDRATLGFVRDYISVASWFVCNIADILICLGILLLIIYEIKQMANKKNIKDEDKIVITK